MLFASGGSAAVGKDGYYFDYSDRVIAYESDPVARIDVHRKGSNTAEETITFVTQGTSGVAGVDHVETTGTVTFLPGESVKQIEVPLLDDNVDDDARAFVVRLQTPYISQDFPNYRSISIIDDEGQGFATFADGESIASESNGTIQVALQREEGLEGELEVECGTTDWDAVAGQDYVGFRRK